VRAGQSRRWVFPIAHAVRNSAGGLQAVLIVGTLIESFRDARPDYTTGQSET
jgi:hypothetical protein